MCSYFLAIGFSDIGWWALLVQHNFISYGFTFFSPFFVQVKMIFFIASEDQVKTGKFTCVDAASTSRRIHAIANNKARQFQVTSPAGCRLTYLQFAGEDTRSVIANCLQLQIILCEIAGIIPCDCAGLFACVCSYFRLRLAGIFTCDSSVFAHKLNVFLPAIADNFAC